MKKKRFFSVNEYAKENHYTTRHVTRLCREGKISAQKIGRNWQILADQTKKPRVTRHYYRDGKSVLVPPVAPDGLIWDMKRGRFVTVEKYAKECGQRVVRKGSGKFVEITQQDREEDRQS